MVTVDGRGARELSSAVPANYRCCRTLGGERRALRGDASIGGGRRLKHCTIEGPCGEFCPRSCSRLALLCPWIGVGAEPADELHDDVAEPLGARSAQHLLLLVSVPSGRREPGGLQFAGGVSRGGSLPADRQLIQLHPPAPRRTTRSTATASSSATGSATRRRARRSACCRSTTTARRRRQACRAAIASSP